MKMICPCCQQEKEIEDKHSIFMRKCYDCGGIEIVCGIQIPTVIMNSFINETNFGLFVERCNYQNFIDFLKYCNLKQSNGNFLETEQIIGHKGIVCYYKYSELDKICYTNSLDWSLEKHHKVYDVQSQKLLKRG